MYSGASKLTIGIYKAIKVDLYVSVSARANTRLLDRSYINSHVSALVYSSIRHLDRSQSEA
jgi:hypothetical protein